MQNVLRLEAEAGVKFEPAKVDLEKATNVLDRWIAAASRNLTAYVRQVSAWGTLRPCAPRAALGMCVLSRVVRVSLHFQAEDHPQARYHNLQLSGKSLMVHCRMNGCNRWRSVPNHLTDLSHHEEEEACTDRVN